MVIKANVKAGELSINHDKVVIKDDEGNVYDYVKEFDTETKVGVIYIKNKFTDYLFLTPNKGSDREPATYIVQFPDDCKAFNKKTGKEIK